MYARVRTYGVKDERVLVGVGFDGIGGGAGCVRRVDVVWHVCTSVLVHSGKSVEGRGRVLSLKWRASEPMSVSGA